MPTEKEIRAEVALQKRKTKRIRELATKGWDKDGNPIWSAGPRKAVVIPPDGTLNEKAVKRYTYSSARPNKPSKPIFWSTGDIGRILIEEKYGSGVRADNIPKIVLDENYVLAVKGQPPISREKNVKFLLDHGYTTEQINKLSDDDITLRANERRYDVKTGNWTESSKSIVKDGGRIEKPDSPRERVLAHKAREFMFARGGINRPNKQDRARARVWYTGLSPADQVEAQSIFHARNVLSAPFRGTTSYAKLPQVHHWGALGEGFEHRTKPETMGILDFEEHRNVHQNREYQKFVADAKDQGFKSIFAKPLWMENLPEATKALLAENVLPTLRKAKPVGKVLSRAIPGLGISLSAKAASDYRKAGQDRLAAMAALSAVPGPLGWVGLAGEMGGLLYNKVTEDPNFLGRGILSDGSHTTPFPVIRQRRGHF